MQEDKLREIIIECILPYMGNENNAHMLRFRHHHENTERIDNLIQQIKQYARDEWVPKEEIDRILKLTNVIRNHSESELDYGTLRTLKMIDDLAKAINSKMMERVNAH